MSLAEYQIASFYKFVSLPDYLELQPHWLETCQTQALKGSILLAAEGLNATVAGKPQQIQALLHYLTADPRLQDLEIKYASARAQPFQRMKVRLKQEIVTLGQADINPNEATGTYVAPADWNDLIRQQDVLLLDTRNDYEIAIGSFAGAINPQTQSFREFPEYVQRELDPVQHKRVAMFCTGGIRCEKASAWMLKQGFETVYHLQGGILNYLESVPAAESLWQGECFVFDERVAVNHALDYGETEMCLGCGRPVLAADQQVPEYEPGVSCAQCFTERTALQKQRSREARAQQHR